MGRYLKRELPRVFVRLVVAIGLYSLVGAAPWPENLAQWAGIGAFAFLSLAIILICGTFLYNTLFYDHYWRQTDSR